jgi:hypothetical protein
MVTKKKCGNFNRFLGRLEEDRKKETKMEVKGSKEMDISSIRICQKDDTLKMKSYPAAHYIPNDIHGSI